MNDVLYDIKEFSLNLLPILGVIVLIVLIILLICLIKTIKTTNCVISKTSNTVDLVDDSLKKVQAPLDSVVKVTDSIDRAHDATVQGIKNAKEYVSKGADKLKDKISNLRNNDNSNNVGSYNSEGPDDILKGE